MVSNTPYTPDINNDSADFVPSMGDYRTLQPFRYWCQKVLPLVYDESLSYYELLCKVVDYLNKTMEDVETLHDDVYDLHEAYGQLQNFTNVSITDLRTDYQNLVSYVNNYFSTLDVQNEINNKLDAMALNGSLTALMTPYIPNAVAVWMNEHLTPTTPVVDDTLSISGAAADAKVTGDNINNLMTALLACEDGYLYLGDKIDGEYVDDTNGTIESDARYERTDYIDVTNTIESTVTIVSPVRSNYNAMYDSNKVKVKTFIVYPNTENVFSVPNNVKYIVFSGSKESDYLETLKVTRTKTYGTTTAKKLAGNLANGESYFNHIGNQYVDNANGSFITYNNWTRSDYVDISNYDKVWFTATNRTPYCAFYDSSKTFVSSFIIQSGDTLLTKPTTAKYCAFSDTTANFGGIVLHTSSEAKIKSLGIKSINDISLKYLDRRDLLAQMTGKVLLMVYTDIHAASDNFKRMASWYNDNLPTYTHAIINLGDTVADQASESIAFMDNAFGHASISVIGNHDVLVGNTLPGITSLEAYNKFIAPNVSSWDVTQPADASVNGLCYFYKDISRNGINLRIIFLCEYFYTQEQHEWFESVLDDAITNNKSVIVCQHQANVTSVGATALGTGSPFATPSLGFDLYITTTGYSGDYSDAAMNRIMAVDTFKANGGKFVCWMSGHTHSDQCHTLQATHGKQLSLVFSNAGMSMTSSKRFIDYAQDCFQYVSVDTAKGYVYALRVGIAEDMWFHRNKFLCYDYIHDAVVEYH